MKIKKGDQVIIMKGKDRGRKSKVLRSYPKQESVLVEGVNIKKKRLRPKREGEKGQVVEVAAPVPAANVRILCSNCGKPARVGYMLGKDGKYRICKRCGKAL